MIKVLLIDRDSLFQKAFAKMIENTMNCTLVGVAESGVQATRCIKESKPNIIFSEIQLGNENGIDICKGIKNSYPDITTYIISNYRTINFMKKAMQAGVENYYVKPLSENVFSELETDSKQEMKEEDEQSRELFQAVEERDYKKCYDCSKEYTNHLYETMDINGRKEALKSVGTSLLYMVPGLDRAQRDYYLQKYKLSTKVLNKSVLGCCWLMQIVTEVFRQLCVMKYTHMNRVLQYIENNKNNEISLSALSEQAGVSSGYLSRIFKKYYHISVVDYIHLRKILIAKQYMVSSEMNISDISFLLGYSEAGYFCKIFKKYESMTPSAFHSTCL